MAASPGLAVPASGPRFSAPGRCSLSCPSAARPWLAVQRRRRRAATVQIPQYPARHASSCSSHPHSGRERGPAGRQIAGAADERCSLDCCACVQISAPARRRLFRPAVSRPALAAPTRLSGLVEKPRSLQGPAERACRRRADHDSAPRKEPDGPSSVVASLPLTGAANCSFAEPARRGLTRRYLSQLTRPPRNALALASSRGRRGCRARGGARRGMRDPAYEGLRPSLGANGRQTRTGLPLRGS